MDDNEEKGMSDKDRAIQALLGNKTSFMNKSEINRIWNSAFQIKNGSSLCPLIIPIIYIPDPNKENSDTIWQSINRNIELTLKFNFNGVILTNHGFMCKDLVSIIEKCRMQYPSLWIGAKFIGSIRDDLGFLIHRGLLNKVNGLWIEESGISFDHSSDVIKHSKASQRLANYRQIKSKWMNGNGLMIGGVEYRYESSSSSNSNDDQKEDDRLCRKLSAFAAKGFLHCIATSVDDDSSKIPHFKDGIGGKCKFAISDGVDIHNISSYLDHGIDAIFPNRIFCDEENRHNFNEFKMSRFRNSITNHFADRMQIETEQKLSTDPDDDEMNQMMNDGLSPVMEEEEERTNAQKPLSPVDEQKESMKGFQSELLDHGGNDDDDDVDDDDDDDDVEMTQMIKNEEEITYQIHIDDAHDVNGDLNGLYAMILDEDKLPRIQHKSADSVFTPNFMYFMKSNSTQKEYGIFIIPSLELMGIYKPTWVIAQINVDAQNRQSGMTIDKDVLKGQQPIYYYASRVDFDQENAMQIPPEKSIMNHGRWLIVGDDGSSEVMMSLKVIALKAMNQRRRDFSAMHSRGNKQFIKEQIAIAKEEVNVMKQDDDDDKEMKVDDDSENVKSDHDPHQYDVDDHKVTTVEEVGHDNILRVTDDLKELKREWKESELGNHDELEMFLGAVGKVVGIEEDDDSVKLEWCNQDCHWLPVKACWIQWRDLTLTAPNFYPDGNEDDGNDDSKLIKDIYGGNAPQ